jgi:pentatricopeptide repeat protein
MTLAPGPVNRIQLCGGIVLERAGVRLDDRLPGRQGRLLFAYLVLNRYRSTTRAELAEALWPREHPAAAEAGINALLSKLRKVLGPGVVDGRSSLRLTLPPDTEVDVETAVAAVHRAESRIALGEFKNAWAPSLVALFIAERELLPGESAPWIDEHRRRMDDVRLRALETHAAAAYGTGGTELPAAVRSGRRLILLAPLRETGYQILMQALARQGNVAEALGVYSALRDLLREELGVSPCAETQAVYDHLLHA